MIKLHDMANIWFDLREEITKINEKKNINEKDEGVVAAILLLTYVVNENMSKLD